MSVELEALGRAAKQLQYRHHREFEVRLATVGTTLAQWDALRAIERLPGATAHALAVATFQSDQAFGALANRLVAQRLVTRRPGHGRRIEHHLTPEGERTLEAGYPLGDEVLRASFAELSEEDRATLLELLLRTLGDDLRPLAPRPVPTSVASG